jgi:SAM-dependent methyltransferase
MHPHVDKLVCPECQSELTLESGLSQLFCAQCSERYRIEDGIPIFIDQDLQRFWDREKVVTTINRANLVAGTNLQPTPENYLDLPFENDPSYCHYLEKDWRRVLELGCGEGNIACPLSKHVQEVYCVDPSPIALRKLSLRGCGNLYPFNVVGEKLPFSNGFFDAVFSVFVIEHMDDPLPMLSEIRRVLRPGGHLVISTDGAFYWKYLRPIIELIRYGRFKEDNPTHVHLMKPGDLRSYLARAGFRVLAEDFHYVGQRHFGRCWERLPRLLREDMLATVFIFRAIPR